MTAIHPKRKVRGVLPSQRCFVWVGMFLHLPNTLLRHINRSICSPGMLLPMTGNFRPQAGKEALD